ncbi:MAG: M23 family metallopeptidase [Syntrophomonas sp.]
MLNWREIISKFLHYYQKNLPLSISASIFILLLLGGAIGFKVPAYSVYVDGEKVFTVENPQEVNQAMDEMAARESKENKDVQFSKGVTLERAFVSRSSILPAKDVEKKLAGYIQMECPATAIIVNGKTVALVENTAAASQLLQDLKKEFSWVDEGEKLLNLGFSEKVQLKEVEVPSRQLMSKGKAYKLIKTGTDNPEKYVVKEGDSLWLIARRNDMYVNDIVVANQLKSEKLYPGQEMILVKSKPYINVIAQVEGNKVEVIPFETQVVVDKKVASSIRVKQDGQNGEKRVEYVATKCNGITSSKEVKKETILKAAVDKIIVKGSKVTMVASRGGGAVGTGNLEWPAYGPITQYYRGGGHTGIDIGARSGSPIRAADSGYVVSASRVGGYGNFIIVNHNNGTVTRYAHCSRMNVSAGESVTRGEVIGAVGSTGNSSGPHLHFEVVSRGSFRNPLDYLR